MKTLLSIVCPISSAVGQLRYLEMWMQEISSYSAQIILIHDFRDELTLNEIRALVQNYSNLDIFFLQGVYGDAGAARNAGLDHVKGEWFCFWDFDDFPRVDEVFFALAEHSDSTVIVGQYVKNSWGSMPRNQETSPSNTKNILDIISNPGLWRFIFRSSHFKTLRFPHVSLGEDQGYLAQIDWSSTRLAFGSRVFYEYSYNRTGQTTTNSTLTNSLRTSILFLRSLLQEPGTNFQLVSGFMLRQCMTLLKRGSWKNWWFILKTTIYTFGLLFKNQSVIHVLTFLFRRST